MTVSLWSLAAYALQLAALVTVAFAAMWMLRIRIPRHSLRLWQAVLAIALLVPLAQAGNVEPSALQVFAGSISAATLSEARGSIVPAGLDPAEHRPAIVVAGIIARLLWLGLGLIKLRSILARATPDDGFADITGELTARSASPPWCESPTISKGPRPSACAIPSCCSPARCGTCPRPCSAPSSATSSLHVKRRDWLQTIGRGNLALAAVVPSSRALHGVEAVARAGDGRRRTDHPHHPRPPRLCRGAARLFESAAARDWRHALHRPPHAQPAHFAHRRGGFHVPSPRHGQCGHRPHGNDRDCCRGRS